MLYNNILSYYTLKKKKKKKKEVGNRALCKKLVALKGYQLFVERRE